MYKEVKYPPGVSEEARSFISLALDKVRKSEREWEYHPPNPPGEGSEI